MMARSRHWSSCEVGRRRKFTAVISAHEAEEKEDIMKYKNVADNRFRSRFMVVTEKMMDKLTVERFIHYLEKEAKRDGEYTLFLGGEKVTATEYRYWETDALCKKFAVTGERRLFYLVSLNQSAELVD